MIEIEALQSYWSCCCMIPQAHKAWFGCRLPWEGENLAYAGRSLPFVVGWRKVVSKKRQHCCLLELHITSNRQSTEGAVWVTLIEYTILTVDFSESLPFFSLLASEESQEGEKLLAIRFFFFFWTWLTFCCVVRAGFPNSWIRVLGVFQTLWSP